MTDVQPVSRRVLEDLRRQYPDTPFLALGQTIWWDEPMKAVLLRLLDDFGLGGRIVLGVHDTDYFAKLSVRRPGQSRFELMPHNDGETKDLWSAAGEISRLFGSETFPTVHDYARHGVPFARIARAQGRDRMEFRDTETEAWGWRGLVYTGSRDLIVHNMPMNHLGDAIERMLSWGFEGSLEQIDSECCRDKASALADRMVHWVRDFASQYPNASLSAMYRALLPRLFEMLLGYLPIDTTVDCTAHLLRLTPETAGLPRFAFVDLFLNEKTRALAARAYNEAVAGTEIYTLDRFGLGALPFDLVLPEHGRGTLRVTLRAIHVETPKPIRIPLKRPVNSIAELAEILTGELGDHVTLVGKAVALISMLAREFIFVFNEEGSGYVHRTRHMNDILRENGVDVRVHPILRVRYNTWEALGDCHMRFSLPDHLAAAFGAREVPASDFGTRWMTVIEEQRVLLETLRGIASPRDLLLFLAERESNGWSEKLAEYNDAKTALRGYVARMDDRNRRAAEVYADLRRVKAAIRDTERAKGDHFRATEDWTDAETAKRAGFDTQIAALLGERRILLARVRDLRQERFAIERGPHAEPFRHSIDRIEIEAAEARMRLVRDAILTTSSLTHTQHRPSAWWIPMGDASGCWFSRIVAGTELYTEPLLS